MPGTAVWISPVYYPNAPIASATAISLGRGKRKRRPFFGQAALLPLKFRVVPESDESNPVSRLRFTPGTRGRIYSRLPIRFTMRWKHVANNLYGEVTSVRSGGRAGRDVAIKKLRATVKDRRSKHRADPRVRCVNVKGRIHSATILASDVDTQ